MNAVIYARFSSRGQREESIADQLRVCRNYAKSNGYTVIQEYCDHALTGKNDDRPKFQQMIADSDSKDFKAIIVWKLDRINRNQLEAITYRYMLSKNGVSIFSVSESIPDAPEGILLRSMLEAMAEMESVKISQNVLRAYEGNALKCKPTGVSIYGYKIIDSERYEIDDETAPLVRIAFEAAAAGKSNVEICRELNATGIKTKRGLSWGRSSLQTMLKNEKYTGVYKFMGHRVEGGMPAIINKDLFDRVQNKRRRAVSRLHTYHLSGKIFCGDCGKNMKGDSGTSKSGEIYHYYTCYGRRGRECDKRPVPQDLIEKDVIKNTLAMLNDEATLEYIADNIMELQKAQNNLDTLKALEKSLKKVETEISNVTDAIAKMGYSETFASKLTNLEEEKIKLKALIRQEAPKSAEVTREFIIYFFEQLRGNTIDDEKANASLLKTFVHAVRLYDTKDYYEIEYNYSDANGKHHTEQYSTEVFDLKLFGSPNGSRTRLSALKGRCPNR